jgi:hypothetical protein
MLVIEADDKQFVDTSIIRAYRSTASLVSMVKKAANLELRKQQI